MQVWTWPGVGSIQFRSMAYLVVKVGGREAHRQELRKDEPVTIGRELGCTLWLAHPKLSRHHCRVEASEGKWVLYDLGSRNGTFVEGGRIDKHVLNDGDTFELGNAEITYHDGPFVPPRPAAPAGNGNGGVIPADLLPAAAPEKP